MGSSSLKISDEIYTILCSRCNKKKNFSSFYRQSASITGYHRWCKSCVSEWQKTRVRVQNPEAKRRWELRKKYGITIEDYEQLLKEQGYTCKLCPATTPGKGRSNFCVDHCHKTGVVRGLLCARCNKGLGLAGDDLNVLKRAAAYLSSFKYLSEPTPKEVKWMRLCVENAREFSTCGKATYFAIVLDKDGILLSEGWNGVPKGRAHCMDGGCDRYINNAPSNSSYIDCPAAHAEQGAIIRSDVLRRTGGTLIVNGTPCHECAKLLIHTGISRVVILRDPAYNVDQIVEFLRGFHISVVEIEY